MKNSTFDRIITLILVLVCIVLAGATYMRAGKNNTQSLRAPAESAAKASNVTVTEVAEGTFVRTSKVMGEIVSSDMDVSVYPSIGGMISSVSVKRGDQVEKGDVLFSVDPSKPGMKYRPSDVTAPVSGTVYEITASVGDTVTTSAKLLVIRGERELKVSTAVSEKNIGALAEGASATVRSDSFDGRTWNAEISYISDTLDTSSRSLPIELSFTEGSDGLLEGMYVTALVTVETLDDVITVPSTCISEFAGEKVVYVAADGKARRTVVSAGRSDGEVTVITSGLQEGDKVITAGNVSDGTPVTIVREE
ncbi:MAG: efflux RND transporter periplasmic adaptor subunit [Bullifex sp.]